MAVLCVTANLFAGTDSYNNSSEGGSDQVSKFPVRFSLFSNCYSFLNPANAGCNASHELTVGNQRMFGAINHVSASYATFHMRLQPGLRNKPFSSAGIILYNDREGKYLNRSRFYISYAWHASLSEKLMFSAGLYVGGMNYSVKGTPLSGDGSDTKADGAVGVSFYTQLFHTDLAFGQIFNSKVQPLEEITVLSPMINVSSERKFMLKDVCLTPSVAARIPITNQSAGANNFLFDFNLCLELRKTLLLSAGVHNNSSLAFAAGISRLETLSGRLGIMLSYAFPAFRGKTIKSNIGEIGINYFF
jgi:hypothetical protein